MNGIHGRTNVAAWLKYTGIEQFFLILIFSISQLENLMLSCMEDFIKTKGPDLPDFGGMFFFGQISISVAICSQEYKFFTKYLMSYARILVFFNFGVAIK